ncbi:EAL domain-containing protein [Chromobacterium piscinae]|uniref:EAL domain-containing protein n=3 Tax=Chromobacterium piscinae TaxID=686831 RepID=A0ABV0H1B7_9NEIS|nr:EAL domain-containing protein [Chromobacterium vaccinii]MBX9357086.1 EAL domain-containing protein [Chromobacterium vaccinii]
MKNISILIVEDERIIAMDLQLQLQALGYQVCDIAASGRLAIACAERDRPDLVLMDIHLEGDMDGVDAASEIYRRLKIPIVFLSAYAENATLQRAKNAMPYGYLVKPISPRELHATLQMAMVRYTLQHRTDEELGRMGKAMQAAELDVWEWRVEADQMQTFSLAGNAPRASGLAANESIRHFIEQVDARDAAAVSEAIAGTRDHGCALDIRFRARAEPGQDERWLHARARCFDDDAGRRIIGVLQDITGQCRAEERLRQAATVFDSTSEGIAILDARRKVVSVNPAFSQHTGYSAEEAMAWPDIDPLYQTPHSFARAGPPASSDERNLWQGNVNYLHKNRKVINIWESISIVPAPDGGVANYVLVFSDISSVLAAQEQLTYLAKHDPLTNLCNRRMLQDRMEYGLAQTTRHQKMMAVLLIDLDHFKTINDSLGHSHGDQLLSTIAARLQGSVRASDTVARLGGDEFCIVLGDIESPGDVDLMAQKLLQRLAEPVRLEQMVCYVTGSIGISMAPADGMSVDELLRNADQAMYGAKHAGRNRYCFFAPAMQKAAEVRLQISNGLHQALEEGQFRLEFQPIIDLASGRIREAEALLRWQHPEHGVINPAVFIPIAEECGLSGKICEWVYDQALSVIREWRDTVRDDLRIAINVSALHFRDLQNPARWLDKLRRAGVPGQALMLEVTESLLLDADRKVQEALDLYRAAGIRIALDDFGTGYSALSYLQRYQLDCLKIDQAFVRRITDEPRDHALCEAIVVMAHKLGLKVIAEGVETPAQAAILQTCRCEHAQGFLYSHPLPADLFVELLRQRGGRLPGDFPPDPRALSA